MLVEEVCRKLGISRQNFYRWKEKCGRLDASEVRRLKVLEEENKKLKDLETDLRLGKQILQEVLSKNDKAGWSSRAGPRGSRPVSARHIGLCGLLVRTSVTRPDETSRLSCKCD